jgi:cell shape-determining protein MreD
MRTSGIFVLYLVIGVLVAAGVIGSEENYFSDLDNLEEILEMLLAVLLWPLVLLDVNINIGGAESGGNESGKGSGGSGGGK